jgi:drug/metabolite transporter (DMT)-like permease
MLFTGEILAFATVLCWTVSVQFFEVASRRVGAIPVNIIRISVALTFFTGLLLIREGGVLPVHFPLHAWIYLSFSGIVGFFIGDIFLFQSFVEVGPRIAMLIFSLAAPVSAIIGYLFLGETYSISQWSGMLITFLGVGTVILEKGRNSPAREKQNRNVSLKGVVFAGFAMLGQAVGYVLSKIGMQVETGYLDAFSATQIRALAALVCFVLYFTVTGKWNTVRSALGDKQAVAMTAFGAFVGPFLGVSMSLLVLHYLTVGVASTILSLVPVVIIPFSVFLHKEYVSVRAIIGACVAVLGIYFLMI